MTDSERENDATLTVSEDGAAAGDARNEREISSDDVPPKPVELYDETSIVHCSTTAGPFVLELYRGWAPRGYDKASTLFQAHAFDDTHFFRCLPGFLVQFGIPYTSSATLWDFALEEIPDDPQLKPPVLFEEGTFSFAGAGKNTRSSEMFISLTPDAEDQPFGEEVWETPVGKVVEGIEVVRSFHSYGERPDQNRMYDEGRKYVEKDFPLMDRFLECTVEKTAPKSGGWDGTEARGVAAIKEAVDMWHKDGSEPKKESTTYRQGGDEFAVICYPKADDAHDHAHNYHTGRVVLGPALRRRACVCHSAGFAGFGGVCGVWWFLGLHTCNLKATLIMRSGAGAAGHGTYKACFLRNFKEF